MRWDYKLVTYSLLTYGIYGVINLFQLYSFVVPLPLSFILAILLSLVFCFRTIISINTILYLGIPLIMLKDLIIFYNEFIGIVFIILGIISWIVLGILLVRVANNNFIKTTGVLLICSPILLLNWVTLSLVYLIILLLFSIKTLQSKELNLSIPLERSLLILIFIDTLYLLNEASIGMVS
jgi:hypothetical protein